MYPRLNGSKRWMMPAASSMSGQGWRSILDGGNPTFSAPHGLAWFCAGERVRALGPDNAIAASGRIFARQRNGKQQGF
jgi:hypothetical protein